MHLLFRGFPPDESEIQLLTLVAAAASLAWISAMAGTEDLPPTVTWAGFKAGGRPAQALAARFGSPWTSRAGVWMRPSPRRRGSASRSTVN